MPELILLNKPFRTLSQFTDDQGRDTLANHLKAPSFRAAGRLDYDSEGLLVLTDNGALQQRIANPRHKLWKTYWVQVEGSASDDALNQLARGVMLKDGPTRPAKISRLPAPPELWPRSPPVRYRRDIPDCWLSVSINEGRNRQVRRMTAAVGLPTLRLVRVAVGQWQLGDLQPGQWRRDSISLPQTPPSRSSKPRYGRKTKR